MERKIKSKVNSSKRKRKKEIKELTFDLNLTIALIGNLNKDEE
jgi:hypothetical protein